MCKEGGFKLPMVPFWIVQAGHMRLGRLGKGDVRVWHGPGSLGLVLTLG